MDQLNIIEWNNDYINHVIREFDMASNDYFIDKLELSDCNKVDLHIKISELPEDKCKNYLIVGNHFDDKWKMFNRINISSKAKRVLLVLEGCICRRKGWNGLKNADKVFRHFSEQMTKTHDFIYSEEKDLKITPWVCSISLGILMNQDFVLGDTINHYMKLIGNLQLKAQQM